MDKQKNDRDKVEENRYKYPKVFPHIYPTIKCKEYEIAGLWFVLMLRNVELAKN